MKIHFLAFDSWLLEIVEWLICLGKKTTSQMQKFKHFKKPDLIWHLAATMHSHFFKCIHFPGAVLPFLVIFKHWNKEPSKYKIHEAWKQWAIRDDKCGHYRVITKNEKPCKITGKDNEQQVTSVVNKLANYETLKKGYTRCAFWQGHIRVIDIFGFLHLSL